MDLHPTNHLKLNNNNKSQMTQNSPHQHYPPIDDDEGSDNEYQNRNKTKQVTRTTQHTNTRDHSFFSLFAICFMVAESSDIIIIIRYFLHRAVHPERPIKYT